MPQFFPDQVIFHDLAGYGMWDVGHAREHLQFVQVQAARTPAVLIPAYDLMSFLNSGGGRRYVLQSHYEAHQQLRGLFGLNGIDLSAVNMDDESAFYDWLSYHSTEHGLIRQAMGIS